MKENNEKFIVIRIRKDNFKIFIKAIKDLSDIIYLWGFDKFCSRKLLEDLKLIRTTMEGSIWNNG